MSETNEENGTNTTETQTQPAESPRYVERNGEKLEITDNFWDKEKNEPDVFALLKSQNDLRKQISEDLSPKDGIYQINIPKEYQDKLAANPEDPLYKEFCQFAKKNRISQEEFDKISGFYYKMMYDGLNEEEQEQDDYYKAEIDKLKAKFGDNVDKMKARIDNFLNNAGITSEAIKNELAFMLTSAEGVETLDFLLGLRGEPMPDINGVAKVGMLGLQELREMQARADYKDNKELQEKVRKGYEALYADR